MATLALDTARHTWMLNVTGGDAAALAEIRTALDRIAADQEPDLGAALALACHRDYLASRSAHIPLSLPAVFAALGHASRAGALARSITDPGCQSQALAEVAGTLAQAGQDAQALEAAEQALQTARSITNPGSQSSAWLRSWVRWRWRE